MSENFLEVNLKTRNTAEPGVREWVLRRIYSPNFLLEDDIDRYAELSIGLQAYRSLIDSRVDAFQKALSNVLNNEPEDSYLTFNATVVVNGVQQIRSVMAYEPDLAFAIANLHPSVTLTTVGDSQRVTVTNQYCIECLLQTIQDMKTVSCVVEYISLSGLMASYKISDLMSHFQSRSVEFSLNAVPWLKAIQDGSPVRSLLTAFFATAKESSPVQEGEDVGFVFDPDTYTGCNAIEAGFNVVCEAAADVFANIKWDWSMLAKFAEFLLKGIVSLLLYVVQLLDPGLLNDYEFRDKATDRGCDIPIVIFSTKARDFTGLFNDVRYTESSQSAFVGTDEVDWLYPSAHLSLVYNQDSLWTNAASLLRDIHNLFDDDRVTYTFPAYHGYVVITRNSDTIYMYYYAAGHGLYSDEMSGTLIRVQNDDGSFLYDDESRPIYDFVCGKQSAISVSDQIAPVDPSTNESVASTILDYINVDPSIREDFNRIWPVHGLGFDLTLDNRSAQYGSEGHCMAKDLIQMLKDSSLWDENPDDTRAYSEWTDAKKNRWSNFVRFCIMRMLLYIPRNRKVVMNDTDAMALRIVMSSTLASSGTSVGEWETTFAVPTVLPYDDFGSIIMPYYKNKLPDFDVHVQTDDERGKEVLALILRVAAVAAVAGVTRGVFKLRNRMAMKSAALDADIFDCMQRIRETDGARREGAIMDLVQMRRKANWMNKLSFFMGFGSTASSTASMSMQVLDKENSWDSDGNLLPTAETYVPGDDALPDPVTNAIYSSIVGAKQI